MELPAKMVLAPGWSEIVCVEARSKANRTRLSVSPRQRYRFSIPAGQTWTDWFVKSSPDGYDAIFPTQNLAAGTKPMPREKWFALCGAIGAPRNEAFLIGSGTGSAAEWSPRAKGELVLFANDAASYYWNNFGRVWAVITRER